MQGASLDKPPRPSDSRYLASVDITDCLRRFNSLQLFANGATELGRDEILDTYGDARSGHYLDRDPNCLCWTVPQLGPLISCRRVHFLYRQRHMVVGLDQQGNRSLRFWCSVLERF